MLSMFKYPNTNWISLPEQNKLKGEFNSHLSSFCVTYICIICQYNCRKHSVKFPPSKRHTDRFNETVSNVPDVVVSVMSTSLLMAPVAHISYSINGMIVTCPSPYSSSEHSPTGWYKNNIYRYRIGTISLLIAAAYASFRIPILRPDCAFC